MGEGGRGGGGAKGGTIRPPNKSPVDVKKRTGSCRGCIISVAYPRRTLGAGGICWEEAPRGHSVNYTADVPYLE